MCGKASSKQFKTRLYKCQSGEPVTPAEQNVRASDSRGGDKVALGRYLVNEERLELSGVWLKKQQQLEEKTTCRNTYKQTKIPEKSRQARNIAHCPPPLTQGRTSQRPTRVSQFRPRTTKRTHSHCSESSLSALSPSLFCLLIFIPFLFQFVMFLSQYIGPDGRQRVTKSCLCTYLMMSSVSSFLSGCSFSDQRAKKKPAVSSCFFSSVPFFICLLFLFGNEKTQKRPAFKCSGRFQSHLNRFFKKRPQQVSQFYPFCPLKLQIFWRICNPVLIKD